LLLFRIVAVEACYKAQGCRLLDQTQRSGGDAMNRFNHRLAFATITADRN
jgi:endonuclease YncB( thermonuclease family)